MAILAFLPSSSNWIGHIPFTDAMMEFEPPRGYLSFYGEIAKWPGIALKRRLREFESHSLHLVHAIHFSQRVKVCGRNLKSKYAVLFAVADRIAPK